MFTPPLAMLALTLASLATSDPGPALQSSFIWTPTSPPGTQAYVAFRGPPFIAPAQHNTTIHLFADTRYQLYVNGQYILRGPCRFNPKRPEHDSLDITSSLTPGANASIVVLVHHYGNVVNGRIISHAPGLSVLVESDDGTVLLQTSAAWKSSNSTQYLPSPVAWSSIPDVIDSRALVTLGDWTQPNYDDSSWPLSIPVLGSLWGALQPRYLPLPRESIVAGVTLLPSGAPLTFPVMLNVGQALTLNLGAMSMAYAVAALNASQAGSTIHMEFALRYVDGAMKETYGVGVEYTTQSGPQTFMGGDQWCAHYVSITVVSGGPVTLTSLHFVARSYPFERAGSFNSSDSLLNEVWLRAANTLAVVTDDAYGSDARERNTWLQDPAQPNFITTRVAFVGPPPAGSSTPAYSDGRLLKSLLRLAALSQLPDGRILSTFPTDRGPEDCHYSIEDYAMQFMEALRMYVDSTGDVAFVQEVYPVVLAQMDYFAARVITNSSGGGGGPVNGLLLAREYTSFDDPLAYVQVQGGALNAFYVKGLVDASYLANILNDTGRATEFSASATAITQTFNTLLWNESVGSYNAGVLPSGRVLGPSVHAALLALERGLVPPERLASVYAFFFANFKNQGDFHCCSNTDTDAMIASKAGVDFPVVYYWVFNVLFSQDSLTGDMEALSEIRRRWGYMVANSPDIDTLWESFQDSESCHNYGSVPLHFLSTYVLGVRVAAPAYQGALVVEPRLGDLSTASGVAVTEAGLVSVSWAVSQGLLSFTLDIPQGVTTTTLRLAGGVQGTLVINGQTTPTTTDGRYVVATLGKGPGNFVGSVHTA